MTLQKHRPVIVAAAAALAIAAAGCAALRSGDYVARTAAFPHYHTWEWAAAHENPTGDPRLDSNPMFEGRVRAAVEHQLASRGYVRTTLAGLPDLRAHYHVNFTKMFDVTSGAHGDSCYGDCGPDADAYEQGTIVVDLVDTRTNELVYRGWARDNMEGLIDDQSRLEHEVDIVVGALFAECPAAR